MPSGIAVRIPNPSLIEADCRIYRLYPALAGAHAKMEHVAAISPDGAPVPQTTVVPCEANGAPRREVEVLKPWQRVPGRGEDEAALANLGDWGYLIIEPSDLARLQAIGEAAAFAYAMEELGSTYGQAQNYAAAHFGVFAARHLVESYERLAPLRSVYPVTRRENHAAAA